MTPLRSRSASAGADRRARDAEALRQLALGTQPLARAPPHLREQRGSRAASAVGPSETAERSTYIASSAISDSGSTCPPSTTIVWPVM